MPFDLVIRNGTLIDGRRTPRYRADVGIRDGRVACIGRLPSGAGEQEIDPIDPVAHEARVLAAWPAAMAKAAALVKGYLRRFPSDLHQIRL